MISTGPTVVSRRSTRAVLVGVVASIALTIGWAPIRHVAAAAPSATLPAEGDAADAGGRLEPLPSSIVVLVAAGHRAAEADAAAAAAGLVRVGANARLGALQYAPAVGGPAVIALDRLLATAGRNPDTTTAAALRTESSSLRGPAIRSAAPPQRERALELAPQPPNDPLYPQQWGLGAVRALDAWQSTQGSPTVRIGIVDTGIDATHPDLAGTVVAGRDFVHGTGDPTDDNGHGTHVAGIIAAQANNGTGIAGLAPGVRLVVAKALDANGDGLDVTIAQAMSWSVDQGARVVNLSLGSTTDSPILDAAVDDAASRGVLVVAAAGNGGIAVGNPANHPPALAVGAVALADPTASTPGGRYVRATYSNYGPELAVVAPGSHIVSTVPPAVAGGSYAWGSGTSMAAPFVSAEAGLIWSRAPSLSAAQVRTAIVSTAVDLGPPGRDDEYGSGLIDVAAAVASVVPPVASPAPGAPAPGATPTPDPSTGAPSSGSGAGPATPPGQSAPDTTPPTVALAGVASGTAVSGVIVVEASADDADLASLDLSLDGHPVVATSGLVHRSVSVAWPSASVADGLHVWRAAAVDSVGNRATVTAQVLVANTHRLATASVSTALAAGRSTISSTIVVRARSPLVAWVSVAPDVVASLRLVNARGRTVAVTRASGAGWLTLSGIAAGRYAIVVTVNRAGTSIRLHADWYR